MHTCACVCGHVNSESRGFWLWELGQLTLSHRLPTDPRDSWTQGRACHPKVEIRADPQRVVPTSGDPGGALRGTRVWVSQSALAVTWLPALPSVWGGPSPGIFNIPLTGDHGISHAAPAQELQSQSCWRSTIFVPALCLSCPPTLSVTLSHPDALVSP